MIPVLGSKVVMFRKALISKPLINRIAFMNRTMGSMIIQFIRPSCK